MSLSIEQPVVITLIKGIELREKKIHDMKYKISNLSRNQKAWKEKYFKIFFEYSALKEGLGKFFDCDQLDLLKGKKTIKWTNKTLKKAISIKIAGGEKLLNIIRKNIVPLPAPRTIRNHLSDLKFEPGVQHFETMREDIAYNLISSDVSRGIDLMNKESNNAISFIIKKFNKLQLLFNNKSGWSQDGIAQFHDDIKFLKYMSDELLPNLKFELPRGSVRCLYGGIIAIKSITELSTYLMDSGNEKVYAKHMINNSTENIFSQVVHRTKKPDVLQFTQSLKAVCVSQINSPVIGNYSFEGDDESNSFDYLAKIKEYSKREKENETHLVKIDFPEFISDRDNFDNFVQRFAFHRDISVILTQCKSIIDECDECSTLISLEKKANGNFTLSPTANLFFSLLERCFRLLEDEMQTSDENFKNNFIENALTAKVFDHCIPIQVQLIKNFYHFRVKIAHVRREKCRANYFGSKSHAADIPMKLKGSRDNG